MQLRNFPEYPFTLRNLGARGALRLLAHLPYYYYKSHTAHYAEKSVNNYRMLLDLRDKGVSRELFLFGTREKEHIIFLSEMLTDGMVALDIGANIGYYSIMMAKLVGGRGQVFAIEPSLSNYQLLCLNLRLNEVEHIVAPFNMGIADTTGVGRLYESAKSNWHTFYPKVHSGTASESLEGKAPISVPVMTIDDFEKGRRKIDLIRMDIEGYEVEVLMRLATTVRKQDSLPKIIFEVHQPRYNDSDHSMRECLRAIFDAGYRVKRLASHITYKGGAELFHKRGYKPVQTVRTDGVIREIFNEVTNEDSIAFICDTEIVRTVVLAGN